MISRARRTPPTESRTSSGIGQVVRVDQRLLRRIRRGQPDRPLRARPLHAGVDGDAVARLHVGDVLVEIDARHAELLHRRRPLQVERIEKRPRLHPVRHHRPAAVHDILDPVPHLPQPPVVPEIPVRPVAERHHRRLGMVLQVRPHRRLVDHRRDPVLLQMPRRPDPRQHQDLRRRDRPRRHHHLGPARASRVSPPSRQRTPTARPFSITPTAPAPRSST